VLAHHELAKSANFADLSLPVSGLYLLAAPSTPAKLPRRLDANRQRPSRGAKKSMKRYMRRRSMAATKNQVAKMAT
jgi:hypothetical protein